ncbi:dihydroxyacetone kinase subunit DhaK [Oscillospiraceae bacterium PP1C4]
MKKIINRPENVVDEMLRGIERAYPTLKYCEGMGVIARKSKADKVGLVSGGGCGHEPAHAGYVGAGMLDAAVAGNVFSSPDPERILCGIKEADAGKGVLLVIKNYSGDYMNFTMAKDLAEMDGAQVDYVVVKDDVAVEDSTFSTGRRGIAGTVFVHKIAGAKAQGGASLPEVKAAAEKAITNVRSMGMAMSSCTLPAVGKPGFELGADEIEIGMGIHGEPGVGRSKMKSAKEIAQTLLDGILADFEKTTDIQGAEVALMVNGLGATPFMELYILNYEASEYLASKGIRIYKTFVGNYMTALEMAGCSLSLLKLDDELKSLLDAPCDAPAFQI